MPRTILYRIILKYKLLLAVAFILPRAVICQNKVAFEHLTVANGLSQSSVFSIAQDKQGFMWFGTRDGLNRYDSRNIKIFKNLPKDPVSISSNNINSILADSKGNVWMGTEYGLNKYNAEAESFLQMHHEAKNTNSLSGDFISQVYEDSKRNIWIGTSQGLDLLTSIGPFKFKHFNSLSGGLLSVSIQSIKEDRMGNLFVGTKYGLVKMTQHDGKYVFQKFINTHDKKKCDIKSIGQDPDGNIWLGTGGGVQFLDTTHNQLVSSLPLLKCPDVKKPVRKIIFSKDGKAWIGTSNGAYLYDLKSGAMHFFENDPEDVKSLGQNSVYDIFQDKDESVWLGTYFGGVSIVHKYAVDFTTYRKSRNTNSIGSNIISAIVEDNDNNLLIGSQEAGLSYYVTAKKKFIRYKSDETNKGGLASNIIKVIYKDKGGKIWIGANYLQLFDPRNKKFTTYKIDSTDTQNNVYAICEKSHGKYWVAARDMGLYIFDSQTKTFQPADGLTGNVFKYKIIKCIFTDTKNNVWFATNNGVFVLNAITHTVEKFSVIHPLPSGNVNIITEDTKKNIWIGSVSGGLSVYTAKDKKITTYTTDSGLPSNTIIGIVEDNSGFLWFSTENGLSRFDPVNASFRNYTTHDGLAGNIFNQNAFLKTKKGDLYFGSYDGLVKFNPAQVHVNNIVAPIVATGIHIYDDKQNNFINGRFVKGGSDAALSIALRYNQNTFKIDFAILNFIKPIKNAYSYRLQGFDKNWNIVKTPSASYTNLPPGKYLLLIKAANNDGIWQPNPLRLQITILPPPWLTWWAYLIYILIAMAILALAIKYAGIKYRLKREQEVHQIKLDFFTNISHELRTPLTLILGPIETLLKDSAVNTKVKTKLAQAKSNADRLLRLVTELLDFRKTETRNLMLQVGKYNAVSFCKNGFASFENIATEKNIHYSFVANAEYIELYFDDIQMEKVLFNLLSNAFKFTPSGGSIKLQVLLVNKQVEITVHDNGKGIPPECHDKIFTSYYQVKEFGQKSAGFGIGLAISKNIIELHHGTISFTSKTATEKNDRETIFLIKMHSGIAHFSPEQLFTVQQEENNKPNALNLSKLAEEPVVADTDKKNRLQILVVEDNEAIRQFIAENLSLKFNVLQCANGSEGLECAFNTIPDIIISDIMMPVMDGIEFCKKIKSDDRTSHIPVILLTALADNIHQIGGLQTGADLYVTKPFNVEVLELSITNMLASRAVMRRKFSKELTIGPSDIIINSTEEEFLNNLMKVVEANMIDPDFGVDKLVTELGMGRNILYKKLDALTGMSVHDIIKSMRLKRSMQLLETQEYAVYEVAGMVGFNDHKYFSKEFKKLYGNSPVEVKTQKGEKPTVVDRLL